MKVDLLEINISETRQEMGEAAAKAVAGKIQTLLLDETPLLFTYFYDFMSAAKKGATGIEVTAMSHCFLKDAKVA